MINRFEFLGISISVACMAIALYLVQLNQSFIAGTQVSQVAASPASSIIVVEDAPDERRAQADALIAAADRRGNLEKMVIDDIVIGTGEPVDTGATVVVHYAGRLQDGTEFDSSFNRNEPFTFTLGAGQVIQGWDEGIVGMKVGGERILVIPPDKAYGEQGIGPIPGGATLIFSVKLLEIR